MNKVQEFSLFEPYGLNKFRNFLSSPTCKCGCGGKSYIQLLTDEDLCDFAASVLEGNNCSESCVFAIDHIGKMWAIVYMPEENEDEPFAIFSPHESYIDFFAECDAEFRLCCYALLIEREKGSWEIIE